MKSSANNSRNDYLLRDDGASLQCEMKYLSVSGRIAQLL